LCKIKKPHQTGAFFIGLKKQKGFVYSNLSDANVQPKKMLSRGWASLVIVLSLDATYGLGHAFVYPAFVESIFCSDNH
jgi:hypothetical protein